MSVVPTIAPVGAATVVAQLDPLETTGIPEPEGYTIGLPFEAEVMRPSAPTVTFALV